MPQLMPLFWMLSTVMTMLLMMMFIKIYGNNFMSVVKSINSSNMNKMIKWYW